MCKKWWLWIISKRDLSKRSIKLRKRIKASVETQTCSKKAYASRNQWMKNKSVLSHGDKTSKKYQKNSSQFKIIYTLKTMYKSKGVKRNLTLVKLYKTKRVRTCISLAQLFRINVVKWREKRSCMKGFTRMIKKEINTTLMT